MIITPKYIMKYVKSFSLNKLIILYPFFFFLLLFFKVIWT